MIAFLFAMMCGHSAHAWKLSVRVKRGGLGSNMLPPWSCHLAVTPAIAGVDAKQPANFAAGHRVHRGHRGHQDHSDFRTTSTIQNDFNHTNQPATLIGRYVDHIYILCMDCSDVTSRLPTNWPMENTSLFHGGRYDACMANMTTEGFNASTKHNWLAGRAHMAIILDARERGFSSHMVIEEDNQFLNESWTLEDYSRFVLLLDSENWSSAKLGWSFKCSDLWLGQDYDFSFCPEECRCQSNDRWCVVRKGCGLGSSHNYILPSRSYTPWLEEFFKRTPHIDKVGLQFDNVIALIPPLSVQTFDRGNYEENLLAHQKHNKTLDTLDKKSLLLLQYSKFREACYVKGER